MWNGIQYSQGKITILSLNMIELEEESKSPLCGTSNSIAVLKDDEIGY